MSSSQISINQLSTPSKTQREQFESPKMTIIQLQDSRRKKIATNNVADKIHQMELFYVGKIKNLQRKVIELQEQNEQLRTNAVNQNSLLKQLQLDLQLTRQQTQGKIRMFQKSVMKKVVEQADECYQTIQQSKLKLQNELNLQRKLRQTLQFELKQVVEQKQHLKQFYKHVVQNHRRLLKADIQRTKQSIKTYDSEDLRIQTLTSAKKKKSNNQNMKKQ